MAYKFFIITNALILALTSTDSLTFHPDMLAPGFFINMLFTKHETFINICAIKTHKAFS